MASRSRSLELCVLVSLLGAGCSSEAKYYPVSGLVTLDGQPVADAAVMFHPKSGGPVGNGVTDAEGKFTLKAANRDGLPAGDYLVTVTKQRTVGVEVGEDGLEKPTGGEARIEYLVPERFGKSDESGLTATVPLENQPYNFTLESK